MAQAVVRRLNVEKYSGLQKCSLCLYSNYFRIEIKKDKEKDIFYYSERCPRCKEHYEEFKEISEREAKTYFILEDL